MKNPSQELIQILYFWLSRYGVARTITFAQALRKSHESMRSGGRGREEIERRAGGERGCGGEERKCIRIKFYFSLPQKRMFARDKPALDLINLSFEGEGGDGEPMKDVSS